MTLSSSFSFVKKLFLPLFVASLLFQACSPRMATVEPTLQERLDKANALFEKKKYYDARHNYDAIRFDYPGDDKMAEVQCRIGVSLFHMDDFLNAETELRIFQRDFAANNEFSDDVAYWLCRAVFKQALPARLDQTGTKKVIEETHAFLEQYNGSEYTAEVNAIELACQERLAEKEFLAGQIYRRMGSSSSAIHYFRLFEKDFPESRFMARNRYEWARSLYDQKNYADALVMTDSCKKVITALETARAEEFSRTEPHSGAYKFFHLFGLIPYETRSDIKIYLDDLNKDIGKLTVKIQKRLDQTPVAVPPPKDSTAS